MRLRAFVCVVSLAELSGCVDAAPAELSPAPLVAVPGPTKTAEEFQQDDLACRAGVAEPPHDLKRAPTALQPAADANPPSKDANAPIRMEAPQQPVVQPGVAYLRCMGSRYNIIEPLSVSQTVTYGSYPAYPVYGGSTDYYPWLYDGYYGGFYNGFCCGVGFGFGRVTAHLPIQVVCITASPASAARIAPNAVSPCKRPVAMTLAAAA